MPIRMPGPEARSGAMPRRSRTACLRVPRLEQVRARHRLADHEALGVGDTGERAELRVAALDEPREDRRGQAGRGRAVAGGRELRAMARERLLLQLVHRADVDDERRRRAVVDEVVADPLGLPRLLAGLDAPEPGAEDRLAEQAARGA